MKKQSPIKRMNAYVYLFCLLFAFGLQAIEANNPFKEYIAQNVSQIKEYKGSILDSKTKEPLAYADININGTNISTITNNEGEFLLKVPSRYLDKNVIVSLLGYEKKEIPLTSLKTENTKIFLTLSVIELDNVSIYSSTDAESLVRATLNTRSEHYYNNKTVMTAFYRETIKKRNRNASLSEALLEVHKQPYTSSKHDAVKLLKSRKNTDYSRLDTLALKLQGGPFSALYTDMVKYPEYIFDKENLSDYTFSLDKNTKINNRPVYVVKFKQKPKSQTPLYFGKLYIDSETLALTSAVYNLNVENKVLASEMFIRKKPRKVTVYPTLASYRVDYRTRNGKWHYGYGNIQLTFKVNWKNRLFNNIYTISSEMAITDWEINNEITNSGEKLNPNVILSDKASGFSDPEFWGEYNIIEPEKSIESAIDKINKQLKRVEI